jgi:purine-binding chemotaxis protein CheW
MQDETPPTESVWNGQHLTFSLGEQGYGVHMREVMEINRVQPVTAIPDVMPWVRGVINLRGTVIPIVDLRRRMGLPSRDDDDRTCIVVVLEDQPVGLVVDRIGEVVDFDPEAVEPVEPVAGAGCLQGIARGADASLTMIIDPRAVVAGA